MLHSFWSGNNWIRRVWIRLYRVDLNQRPHWIRSITVLQSIKNHAFSFLSFPFTSLYRWVPRKKSGLFWSRKLLEGAYLQSSFLWIIFVKHNKNMWITWRIICAIKVLSIFLVISDYYWFKSRSPSPLPWFFLLFFFVRYWSSSVQL